MDRFLVLFARDPAREARVKGFDPSGAEDLFASFAFGWLQAAEEAGARLVVSTPAEDLAAWRARLPSDRGILWICQRGRSFGERLEESARRVALRGGRTVLVGGDVPPCARSVRRAFDALERGANAVLAPAPDGGVSLVGLEAADLDLLKGLAAGSRDVFETLERDLAARRRSVALVGFASDVDGRRDLRRLVRARELSGLRYVARRALAVPRPWPQTRRIEPRSFLLAGPSGLRAPPASA